MEKKEKGAVFSRTPCKQMCYLIPEQTRLQLDDLITCVT